MMTRKTLREFDLRNASLQNDWESDFRCGSKELHGLKATLLHNITEKESNEQTIQANSKRNRLQQPMKPIAFIPKSNLSS